MVLIRRSGISEDVVGAMLISVAGNSQSGTSFTYLIESGEQKDYLEKRHIPQSQ